MLKSMNMPQTSSRPDNGTGSLTPERSTTISSPWTAENTGELSISSSGDSPASPIQSQETGPVKQTKEIYGLTQCELLGTWDRDLCFWRTCQVSMFHQEMDGQHMGEPWSGNFPNSGIVWNGMLYRRPTQEHPISANDGGLWPTPKAGNPGSRPNGKGGKILNEEVQIAEGLRNRGGLWPTPTVQDSANNGAISQINRHGPALNVEVKVRDAEQPVNSALNPDWVEWLMGLPKGWTSLEPMDPDAFEEWATDMTMGTWGDTERGIPRVTTERTNRAKRLKALGNGIVPASCALFAGTVKRD